MLNIPERLFIMNSVLNPDIQINVKCLVVFRNEKDRSTVESVLAINGGKFGSL